ncbi:MAG: DUF2786 domain-containing protein [Proteobacteria bacterium]|nr:DUF2786 domain-containing protein [Pseudomonadota bacterium]
MDERLKARIAALRAKTMENGCSEEEAATAARLLGNILDMHGLTLGDVENMVRTKDASGCKQFYWGQGRRLGEIQYVAWPIAKLFDCKVWRHNAGVEQRLAYFGLEQDAFAACAMTDMIENAMETEWRRWFNREGKAIQAAAAAVGDVLALRKTHGKRQRGDFMMGMAGRLTQRLEEMRVERMRLQIEGTPGTALVVLKDQLVTQAFAEMQMNLRPGRRPKDRSDTEARRAGVAAAERVNITVGGQIK